MFCRMEITEEQYARIKESLPVQRGNVSLTNLQVLNAILYVWRNMVANGGGFLKRLSAAGTRSICA